MSAFSRLISRSNFLWASAATLKAARTKGGSCRIPAPPFCIVTRSSGFFRDSDLTTSSSTSSSAMHGQTSTSTCGDVTSEVPPSSPGVSSSTWLSRASAGAQLNLAAGISASRAAGTSAKPTRPLAAPGPSGAAPARPSARQTRPRWRIPCCDLAASAQRTGSPSAVLQCATCRPTLNFHPRPPHLPTPRQKPARCPQLPPSAASTIGGSSSRFRGSASRSGRARGRWQTRARWHTSADLAHIPHRLCHARDSVD
mmetsp:Transcript_146820/g.471374  ORF Transcript_146820/g.471374 Transcript_146820/m.471374 type:complete len:255 (+) Transcript_146820:159-923(+)